MRMVFAFGRMNPPTKGHGALIQRVLQLATDNDAEHTILIGQQCKTPALDPLSWEQKIHYARLSFPDINISDDQTMISAFHFLEDCLSKGYEKIIYVGGSDQFESGQVAKRIIDWSLYKGHGTRVEVHQINRDDSDTVTGMSATKARQAATQGEYELFSACLSDSLSDHDKREVYQSVVKGIKHES